MKHRILLVFAAVVLAIAGGFAICRFLGNGRGAEVTAAGTVEVREVSVTAREHGTLGEFPVGEGDRVGKGDLVARLVRADLQAQAEQDIEGSTRARALLKDLQSGARPQEIREAEAAYGAARIRYDLAQGDFARFSALYSERVIAKKEMDDVTARRDLAKSDLEASRQRLSLVRSGARPEILKAQAAEVRRIEALHRVTMARIADTVLVAPLGGVILSKNFEEGEFVPAGAVLATVADLSDCWVKVYLPSTVLGRLNPGQAAEIRVDSFPDRAFKGHVRKISDQAEFTPRQSLTTEERANLVFAVEIAVDNPDGALKPGMPADVILHD